MLRICAWCEKKLGEKSPLDCELITWSICPDCLVEVRASTEVTEQEKEELYQVWAKP
ncbi:hypothetical protein LCGC14_1366770 [marine sediment metagenome]|uniref:Uncharacterized protein n=1 Tax=marine sediment metagenome TaxID=412755 RepID=A0A0F9MLN6_9ZZZZ